MSVRHHALAGLLGVPRDDAEAGYVVKRPHVVDGQRQGAVHLAPACGAERVTRHARSSGCAHWYCPFSSTRMCRSTPTSPAAACPSRDAPCTWDTTSAAHPRTATAIVICTACSSPSRHSCARRSIRGPTAPVSAPMRPAIPVPGRIHSPVVGGHREPLLCEQRLECPDDVDRIPALDLVNARGQPARARTPANERPATPPHRGADRAPPARCAGTYAATCCCSGPEPRPSRRALRHLAARLLHYSGAHREPFEGRQCAGHRVGVAETSRICAVRRAAG